MNPLPRDTPPDRTSWSGLVLCHDDNDNDDDHYRYHHRQCHDGDNYDEHHPVLVRKHCSRCFPHAVEYVLQPSVSHVVTIFFFSFFLLHHQDMAEIFKGPEEAAKAVAEFFPSDRANKLILDVAAGTGLVGEHVSLPCTSASEAGVQLPDRCWTQERAITLCRIH